MMGDFNFVNHTASSACEELAALIFAWNEKFITKEVAHALLIGILYDSQSFGTQSTTIRTIQIVAKLVSMWNINIPELKHELATLQPPSILAFWGKLLNTIKTTKSGQCAWISVTKKDLIDAGMNHDALNGFSNAFASLCSTEITVLFYETHNGKSKASFRSKYFDVNTYAAKFGGGGHTNASGISNTQPLNELIADVLKGL
jgi:phosphoesterase RecJ-like protein